MLFNLGNGVPRSGKVETDITTQRRRGAQLVNNNYTIIIRMFLLRVELHRACQTTTQQQQLDDIIIYVTGSGKFGD